MSAVTVHWTPHWYRLLFDCIKTAQREIFLISPWLKVAGAELILNGLLENTNSDPEVRLLTTLEEADLVDSCRISDLEAYMLFVSRGIQVRAVRGLHAKIYLFDDSQAIVTSGNLTSRGLGRTNICNLEVALHTTSPQVVSAIKSRLLPIWERSAPLTSTWLKYFANRLAEISSHVQTESYSPSAPDTHVGTQTTDHSVPWWQQPIVPDREESFSIALQASDLLASLEDDAELGDAFATIRGLRSRSKRRRVQTAARGTSLPFVQFDDAHTASNHEVTEPASTFLSDQHDRVDGELKGEGIAADTDAILLNSLYYAIEQEEDFIRRTATGPAKDKGDLTNAVSASQSPLPRVGDVFRGRIVHFQKMGALVALRKRLRGMLPYSEVDWRNDRLNLQERFKIGDECDVVVLGVKRSKSTKTVFVTLSHRQTQPNPWDGIADIHPIGSRPSGRVVEFLPFGATVEFNTGFRALVHDKEVSWTEKNAKAENVFRLGDEIDTLIESVDAKRRKIHARYRKAIENPWASISETYPVGTVTTGIAVRHGDHGVYLRLANGCVGLLHKSRIPVDAAAIEIGKVLSIEVATIDAERRRISFETK